METFNLRLKRDVEKPKTVLPKKKIKESENVNKSPLIKKTKSGTPLNKRHKFYVEYRAKNSSKPFIFLKGFNTKEAATLYMSHKIAEANKPKSLASSFEFQLKSLEGSNEQK